MQENATVLKNIRVNCNDAIVSVFFFSLLIVTNDFFLLLFWECEFAFGWLFIIGWILAKAIRPRAITIIAIFGVS